MAGCSDLPVGWERLSPVHMVRWAKSVMSKHRHASVATADFISNSAILTAIRPDSVLAIVPHTRPGATEMADFTAKFANPSMV